MKKLAGIFVLSVYLLACNNDASEKPVADSASVDKPADTPPVSDKKIDYAYSATLASDWQIGNHEYAAVILKLYRQLEGSLVEDSVLRFFADSITSIAFDDRTFKGTGRQFFSKVKDFKSQYKSLDEEFISFVPLYSPSAGIHQVSIWVKERGIRTNGRPDSTVYQENWRFNDQGKIYFRSAYARYGF